MSGLNKLSASQFTTDHPSLVSDYAEAFQRAEESFSPSDRANQASAELLGEITGFTPVLLFEMLSMEDDVDTAIQSAFTSGKYQGIEKEVYLDKLAHS